MASADPFCFVGGGKASCGSESGVQPGQNQASDARSVYSSALLQSEIKFTENAGLGTGRMRIEKIVRGKIHPRTHGRDHFTLSVLLDEIGVQVGRTLPRPVVWS